MLVGEVMEWRLWEGDEPPIFTQPKFFETHPYVPGAHQVGYEERVAMVVDAVEYLWRQTHVRTLCDLGCGDGTFLSRISHLPIQAWGYDAGHANVEQARRRGLNVRQANILDDSPRVLAADVTTITEVLEHLADPHNFVAQITSSLLVATSPLLESDHWHYEHHAWAWDSDGYTKMITDAGWDILDTQACIARGTVAFPPSYEWRAPQFQCVIARKR